MGNYGQTAVLYFSQPLAQRKSVSTETLYVPFNNPLMELHSCDMVIVQLMNGNQVTNQQHNFAIMLE